MVVERPGGIGLLDDLRRDVEVALPEAKGGSAVKHRLAADAVTRPRAIPATVRRHIVGRLGGEVWGYESDAGRPPVVWPAGDPSAAPEQEPPPTGADELVGDHGATEPAPDDHGIPQHDELRSEGRAGRDRSPAWRSRFVTERAMAAEIGSLRL